MSALSTSPLLTEDFLLEQLNAIKDDRIITSIEKKSTGNPVLKTASNTLGGKLYSWICGKKQQVTQTLKDYLQEKYGKEAANFAFSHHHDTSPITASGAKEMFMQASAYKDIKQELEKEPQLRQDIIRTIIQSTGNKEDILSKYRDSCYKKALEDAAAAFSLKIKKEKQPSIRRGKHDAGG